MTLAENEKINEHQDNKYVSTNYQYRVKNKIKFNKTKKRKL